MEEYVAKSILKKELNIANLHSGIVSALQNIVDEIPAANVQEVKHAHWAWYYDIDQDRDFKEPFSSENKSGWICSHCKGRLEDLVGGKWDEIDEPPVLEYCPHCGAKMDEKGELELI